MIKKERKAVLKLKKQEKIVEIKILNDNKGEKSHHIIDELNSSLFISKNENLANEEKLAELKEKAE